MRNSSYSLLIICEGRNTEPLFFNAIKQEIKKGSYNIDIPDMSIEIRPEPIIDEEVIAIPKASEAKLFMRPIRKAQVLRKALKAEPDEIKGSPPLKWVVAGQDELRDGTFNEVWVVFDHDDHPTRKEAFERSADLVNGRTVNIAFSSRSFEYYLLLHFEKIFNAFSKTECKTTGKNKKSLKCGTKEHSSDCGGVICINGYATVKGYWNDSKGDKSMFPVVKDKLEIGFENSVWLRIQSDKIEKGKPIYERNPWLNSDELVKRLTGSKWHGLTEDEFELESIKVTYIGAKLTIHNLSPKTIIIPNGYLTLVKENSRRKSFGDRVLINSEQSITLDLTDFGMGSNDYFIFAFEGINILLSKI